MKHYYSIQSFFKIIVNASKFSYSILQKTLFFHSDI